MDSLPDLVTLTILSFLDAPDIASCACIGRAWADCTRTPVIQIRLTHEKPKAIAQKIGDEDLLGLLESGNLNTRSTRFPHRTALIDASTKGYVVLAKALIEGGADIHAGDISGRNALHASASSYPYEPGRKEITKTLIAAGACVDATTTRRETPLILASLRGHLEVVTELINAGADVHAVNLSGHTPLHNATVHGHLEVMEVLDNAGANLDARSRHGWTPLMIASTYGREKVAQFLIDAGASVNATNDLGGTALHQASKLSHINVVEALLNAGATVNVTDNTGKTPIDVSTTYKYNSKAITSLLRKAGASSS